jgi:hypothetical protein
MGLTELPVPPRDVQLYYFGANQHRSTFDTMHVLPASMVRPSSARRDQYQ